MQVILCELNPQITPLNFLTHKQSSIMRAIGAGVRVFEVLDRTPAIPHSGGEEIPAGLQGIVKFENIGFHYPSRKGNEILKDFNLEVKIGETVAIVYADYAIPPSAYHTDFFHDRGESGGGKSSIHSLLLRYYDPVHGKVTFDGRGT